jgi:hypothetical protein
MKTRISVPVLAREFNDLEGDNVSELKTDWRDQCNTLVTILIDRTVQQSEFVSMDEDVKGCIVREFLVLCRFVLGLGIRNPIAEGMLAEIDEELDRYDPQCLDVLRARLDDYRDAVRMLDHLARCDDARPSLNPLVFEASDETMSDWLNLGIDR